MCTVVLGLSNVLFMMFIVLYSGNSSTLSLVGRFCFMSIFVVYLCKTLTQLIAHNGDGIVSKTKYIFNILGLFLQLMFLLPSVVLDFFRVPYFSANYSGSVCFPTGFQSNPVFVSGSINLSIILNTIALIRIIIYVTRNCITMSQVRKTNSFQEGQVYFRIRVISGIFWEPFSNILLLIKYLLFDVAYRDCVLLSLN